MSKRLGKIDPLQKHLLEPGEIKDFGDLQVESFAVSHDAAEPQFYQVHHDDQTFCVLTDTGYVSDRIAGTIRDADTYLMECNHDVRMLEEGPYTWALKQRILGDDGHLSNEEGANALMSVVGHRTNEILLGHRSQHNNRRSLAHLTVASLMTQHDFGVDHDFILKDAEPEEATPLTTV
jgi:phosphoribosyl 1,2-cyclic phosphodiesterase